MSVSELQLPEACAKINLDNNTESNEHQIASLKNKTKHNVADQLISSLLIYIIGSWAATTDL